ncbi:hypothetical protein [Marinagarivorans algicola]|uniref:hypothetical protein n=1 Tax=Marinagarivorans algicola TaxID=1513270 RepID=UPI0006B418BB|nr:hypothetical protein [Marinagarivorans algicola]
MVNTQYFFVAIRGFGQKVALAAITVMAIGCTGGTTPKPPTSTSSQASSSLMASSASSVVSSMPISSTAMSSTPIMSPPASSVPVTPSSAMSSSSVSMIPHADQCNNTPDCRITYGSRATDCRNSAATTSVCLCGSARCDSLPPTTSSSTGSTSSASTGCDNKVAAGKTAYMTGCQACHGEVPTDGQTRWAKAGKTIDTFDSDNDGYQPRGGVGKQMMPLGDFIAMYMPNTSTGIGQPKGDNIAAYIAHTVKQPWCPGDDWPDAGQHSSGSASSTSGDLSRYRKGELIYEADFTGGNRNQWTGGAIRNGIFSLVTPAGAGHGSTARLSGLADWDQYQGASTRNNLKGTIPNDFDDTIIEFDLKFVVGNTVNIVIDDWYSRKYTHAGHISRVQVSTNFILIRDDIGGVFGLKEVEKKVSGAELNRIKAQYFSDLASKDVRKNHSLVKNKWYTMRVVMHGSRTEFHMAERGQPLQFKLALDSPGKIEGHLAQPPVAQAADIGRPNKQPRGLDHFKSKWGWTTPSEGEVQMDNVKIWAIVPE